MSAPASCVVAVDVAGKTFDQARREFEARLIEQAMNASQYRRIGAAKALGITLDRLRRHIEAGRGSAVMSG